MNDPSPESPRFDIPCRDAVIDGRVLPEGAGPPRVIVCEASSRWAIALRREGLGRRELFETRSLAGCWDRLAEAPSSFVILELTRSNVDDLLARVVRMGRDYLLARVAVVTTPALISLQWMVREAGVVHMVNSTRQADQLAAIARRHLAQAARPSRSLTDQIWAALPWPHRATDPGGL
ncbi:MAG: hypothetical protein JW818_03880 [Pirellulales bacterium]|nr:hypothetical protein [Pirellulales bacterium]